MTQVISPQINRAVQGFAALGLLCAAMAATVAGRAQTTTPDLGSTGMMNPSTSQDLARTMAGGQDETIQRSSLSSQDISTSDRPLSSAEIISLLGEQPDLITQIKSVAVDQLSRAGAPVQEEDITDEMLYNAISTNLQLRTSVSIFLRARGYLDGLMLSAPSATGFLDTSAEPPASTLRLSDRYATEQSSMQPQTNTAGENSLIRPSIPSGVDERMRVPVTESSTSEPRVLRQPAPYNLQSMRDLYTQLPDSGRALRRFGSELFLRTRNSSLAMGVAPQSTPLDVPIGPDYVLGPGDTLSLRLWGNITQTSTLTVDRDGNLLLPEVGPISIAGLTLSKAQPLIESSLQGQYRNTHVSVTVARLRSVRVYVVGDVQRPGGYDISPLATPLSLVYAAGGPTAAGSLRSVRHMRGEQLVRGIDLYDILVHGVRSGAAHFQSGDTLLVPPTGAQVAISGSVLRPAIYELKGREETLASVIADAGGTTAAAALDHIVVERINAHKERETLTLNGGSDDKALDTFKVRDGDRVVLSAILPYSEHVIYLEGHVVRPGRLPWVNGMRICDVLHGYRDLLPEPASQGEIVRLVPPDLHAEIITFDLSQVLIGNDNLSLQPFDTIRIRGRYEQDAPKVTINGEVLRPGTFPLSENMTVAGLVRMAGGFKRDAFLDKADLTSYSVVDGQRVVSKLSTVRIGVAVDGSDPSANLMLKPGDILTVHQVTAWNDIGEAVTINGQVAHPGSYGLRDGERLSSLLRRAGGFRDGAYPEGTVLVREEVRVLEEKTRQELIRQIETSSAAARVSPALAGNDNGATLKLIDTQQEQILARLKSEPSTGRMVVHIDSNVESWANTPADVELRRGDVITIPKRPGFILVSGQVYNPTALSFTPGKTAGWYLSRAGGANSAANRKEIFVIRANGSVVGRRSSSIFAADVLATRLNPGDVVVVPQKIIGTSQLWRNLLTAAQLASSISITAAVAAL